MMDDDLPAHVRRHPRCDCGACCDACGHTTACMSGRGKQLDIRQEIEQEDGYMR